MEIVKMKLSSLEPNAGQIEGLPVNPRQWTRSDIESLARSLKETPELFEARPIIVYPVGGGKFVILGGNMRYEASRVNKASDVPVIVIPAGTSVDRLKEIVIKDNGSWGDWNYDALANDWDDLPLTDWGVPSWDTDNGDDPLMPDGGSGGGAATEKDEHVEELLNEAMRENVREVVEQIDYTMKRGWIASFFTKGAACAKFLRAKYYGEHYPQYLSLYFCPERFYTSANTRSCYDQFRKIADGADDGIAGLRTVSGDNLLLLLLKGSYPFGGARMPMDFPANLAKDLIMEFGGRGCSVLDPCHGWGGRLCGALMADVSLYVGVDPSEEAHRGLERQRDAFLPYCKDSSVELIQSPFEDADLTGRTFDMAITSPPYFDVEQYHGEGQAHIRYGNYELWVRGFYRELIRRTFEAIKDGGVFVLQVGSQSYPLLQDGRRIAEEVGFTVEDIRPFGRGTSSQLHGNTDEDEENEKIIILRKGAKK